MNCEQKPLITMDLYFHVIMNEQGAGNLTDDQIQKQVDVLNGGLKGDDWIYPTDCQGNLINNRPNTYIQFELKGVTRTSNDTWFEAGVGDTEYEFKSVLRVGGCDVFNIYTANTLSEYYWGWAYYPDSCEDWPDYDGVVIDYRSLPDGECCEDYDRYYGDYYGSLDIRGNTLLHEVGHWLGLYHTFQGGCFGSGDCIDDTPPVKEANYGCSATDSCGLFVTGTDHIHNYMDYTDDCCMYQFTNDQVTRMHATTNYYRILSDTGKNNTLSDENKSKTSKLFPRRTGPCSKTLCENDLSWRINCQSNECSGCPACSKFWQVSPLA